jgi:hypothetical protein
VRGTRWLPTFELAGGEATLPGAGGGGGGVQAILDREEDWCAACAWVLGPATPTASRGSCGHDVCDERLVLSQLRYIKFGYFYII